MKTWAEAPSKEMKPGQWIFKEERVLSDHLAQTPLCPVVESEAQRDHPR